MGLISVDVGTGGGTGVITGTVVTDDAGGSTGTDGVDPVLVTA
jgi:hypothetical protein